MNPKIVTGEGGTIILESDAVRIVIDPQAGGKIRSFFSKQSQSEFLYTDSKETFSSDTFSLHDISGFDDCFPTVAPCAYPSGKRKGSMLTDHGWLWSDPWQAEITEDRVRMFRDLVDEDCFFERTCSLEDACTLRLDYLIRNSGAEPLKYVYSAHPMLYGDADTEFVFPETMKRVYVYLTINGRGLEDGTWMDWPPPDETTLNGPFVPEWGSVAKLFSEKLSDGRASIRHKKTGEALQIEFDTDALPHLGILLCQGFDAPENPNLQNEILLGLEPTTGVGDDLPTCERTGTLCELPPNQELRFWIKLSLRSQ